MRSFGFLLSRRWLLFAAAIAVVAYATWWLGEWQFHRLEDRKADNAVVRANEARDPAAVGDVLAPGREVDDGDEWRVVTATGTYAPGDTVVVRYSASPRTEESGVDVVVPLVTADGTALLVNRGWMPTINQGGDIGTVPEPPAGEVTVTGYVRADGSGDSTRVNDGSTRAVDSDAIGAALDREVYGGWVELRSEDPPAAEPLVAVELPELDNGPHFFYGLQWWFFGVLAIGGFGWFAYDEWRGGPSARRDRGSGKPGRPDRDARRARRERYKQAVAAEEARRRGQIPRSAPPSTGSIAPETYDAAGESRNAAARPNSSGSP
ncbi:MULTISPECIES: SURF1 family cytochrome oxidase biogenesis protein [unclassified Nocardioides]|uniref:SURF1 family cytochrome oxidase biogenesis protein n=1 Tax=unclassified Nocardioides TaxID=2615069 RepID=UPI00301451EA